MSNVRIFSETDMSVHLQIVRHCHVLTPTQFQLERIFIRVDLIFRVFSHCCIVSINPSNSRNYTDIFEFVCIMTHLNTSMTCYLILISYFLMFAFVLVFALKPTAIPSFILPTITR